MTGYIATGINGSTHVWVGCTEPNYDNDRKRTGELLHILRFTPDEARYVIEQLQLEIQRVEQGRAMVDIEELAKRIDAIEGKLSLLIEMVASMSSSTACEAPCQEEEYEIEIVGGGSDEC